MLSDVSSYTRCTWDGLEDLFSSCCAVVSVFWFLVGNRFWCYLLTYLEYNTVVAGLVLVFWFWREIVFGITYTFSVQYTCAVVSVFWLWREIVLWQEIVLKMRTPFDFLWAVSTKTSYWVTLLWSKPWCIWDRNQGALQVLQFPNRLIFSFWRVITRSRWVITRFFYLTRSYVDGCNSLQ